MNQSILFPDLQTWDDNTESIHFPAQQSGALIECVISSIELGRLSNLTIEGEEHALKVFKSMRFDIEELVEDLIEAEEYDSSGAITLKV